MKKKKVERCSIDAYICQNVRNGWRTDNPLGYKFGWAIGLQRGETLKTYNVNNLKKINHNVLLNIVELSFPKR